MVFLFYWCNDPWVAISICGVDFRFRPFSFTYVYERFRLMSGSFLLPRLRFVVLIGVGIEMDSFRRGKISWDELLMWLPAGYHV
jgi:hypothetical protein